MIMVWNNRCTSNTLNLLLTFLRSEFQDIHSPDKLSDHDVVVATLKVVIPPSKKEKKKKKKKKKETSAKGAFISER